MRPLVVATLVLVGIASAAPASAGESLVRPGLGIGKLQLGMSLSEARKALGGGLQVVRSRQPLAGIEFREYRTRDGLWRVALLGPRGRERVARIVSTAPAQRTRQGVGVGTDVAAVSRKLRALEPECRTGAVFLNYRLHGLRTTHCGVVSQDAVTVFQGRAECASPPVRYQGCTRIRVPVAWVAVESLALRRYELAIWSAEPAAPGLAGSGLKDGRGKPPVESDEKNLLRRMVT